MLIRAHAFSTFVRRHAHPYSVSVTAIVLVMLSYNWRLWLLEARVFDPDEFEHLHSAWLIFKGFLPYRDFYDNHTPWFHFLVAPFFSFFNVDTVAEDSIAFLFFARRIMWLLAGVILWLTFWLGKLWRDARVGLIAALFLVNTTIFLQSSLEVRPDVLAIAGWLGCLAIIVYAVQSENGGCFRAARYFAWSGAVLGAAIMANQKVLFALPGVAVGLVWYILDFRTGTTRRNRMLNLGYGLIGFSAPVLLTFAYFYLQDGLGDFLYYNFILTAGWTAHRPLYRDIHLLIYQNPYLAFFSAAGLIRVLLSVVKRDSFFRGGFILAPSTLALIAGLFVIPVANLHYYLLFLPLLALFAGAFVVESVDRLTELRRHTSVWKWSAYGAVCSLGILTGLILIGRGAGSPWGLALVVAYWFSTFLAALILLSVKTGVLALAFFLAAMSAPPLKQMYDAFEQSNTAQLDGIRYVIENTEPTDTVMDGFTGAGVFRPHAYYYYKLYFGIRVMLKAEDWDDLLKGLQDGRVSPKLIIFDKDLRGLPPAITAFLTEHYRPAGKGDIWRRQGHDDNLIKFSPRPQRLGG